MTWIGTDRRGSVTELLEQDSVTVLLERDKRRYAGLFINKSEAKTHTKSLYGINRSSAPHVNNSASTRRARIQRLHVSLLLTPK